MIQEPTVVSATHPDFGAAAVEAVRRWEFDATLLNCVPMETDHHHRDFSRQGGELISRPCRGPAFDSRRTGSRAGQEGARYVRSDAVISYDRRRAA